LNSFLPKRDAVILASASSGGTIASVRAFARAGIEAHVIASARLAAARWSRYVARVHSAPREVDNGAFLKRLVEIGQTDPGLVLLPTSDETAWLFAEHAELLGKFFRLYQPARQTLRRILDKRHLADAVRRAGLNALPTWDPENENALLALSFNLPFPVLIKPRTHVNRLRNDKGIVVESQPDLLPAYRRFVAREGIRPPTFAEDVPHRPILQPFALEGSDRVQSVTGFMDRSGELFVTRRSVKVFQRSQPVGIGVCHESLPTSPTLANAVHALCRELRYFGLFEVEFIRFNGQLAVIDFNPRLYNQIGLDIRRGMPLPVFAFLDATGQATELRDAVMKAREEDEGHPVFSDRFTMELILLAQAIFSKVPRAERAEWRRWLKQHATDRVDVALDADDPAPSIAHALSEIALGIRALPRFPVTRSRKMLLASNEVQKASL
jgi:D-aspartate ligase